MKNFCRTLNFKNIFKNLIELSLNGNNGILILSKIEKPNFLRKFSKKFFK